MKTARVAWIDHCRALAVLWMILFHFTYDLRLFSLPSLPSEADWYWEGFPRLIVATFMFSMGLSLDFAQSLSKLSAPRFWKRWLKIAAAAALVSLATWLSFAERWVYFGTLHCIAVCSLLVWPFLNRPKLALLAGAGILVAETLGVSAPWFKLDHPSMDYIPPWPWLAWSLVGVAARPWLQQRQIMQNWPQLSSLSFWGRHSLKIYLLHQPLLMLFVWGLAKLSTLFDGA